jgi:hypothetical protein
MPGSFAASAQGSRGGVPAQIGCRRTMRSTVRSSIIASSNTPT